MRYVLILIACLFLGNAVLAEEATWLNTDSPENSSFFAPKVRFSRLDGKLALWPGARIGWIKGSVISFGFEGYMLANEFKADSPDTARFSMAVGGIAFEAIPSPERRSHVVLSLLLGAGGAQVGGSADFDSLSQHRFLVMEPGFGLEFNLTRFIKLSPGVSYLWISGDVPGMSSPWRVAETAFNLTLKFKDPS
jgi:hypothetical protein